MNARDNQGEPVVEPNAAAEAAAATVLSLRQRIRQQEILSELGVSALQGAALGELLTSAARLAAEGLQAEFSKVLEHLPSDHCLIVRAGVGWEPGIVGSARIGDDLESPAGFALRTGKPVISNHLKKEERFRTPELLQRHGVHRAMNVILQGDGRPYGVLEVDSRSEARFVEHDLAFLQGAANILGMAIERDRHERNMKAALERHEFLRKEMNHRVKNSLTIVISMLRLQSRQLGEPGFSAHMEEAAHRVSAIAQAHDLLHRSEDTQNLDVGRYVAEVCKDLNQSIGQCEVIVEAEPGILISTDRAISSALAVNELIANAVKYAYSDGAAGRIRAAISSEDGGRFRIAVRDDGAGLPEGFDLHKTRGLGMRIVLALVEQMSGELSFARREKGSEFIIIAPLATP